MGSCFLVPHEARRQQRPPPFPSSFRARPPPPSLSQVLDFDFYLSPIFLHLPIHVFLLSTRTSQFCMYMYHICFFKSTSISFQLLPLFLLPSLSLHLVFSLRILDVGFTILFSFQSKKATVLRTVLLYLLVFFVCATDYF